MWKVSAQMKSFKSNDCHTFSMDGFIIFHDPPILKVLELWFSIYFVNIIVSFSLLELSNKNSNINKNCETILTVYFWYTYKIWMHKWLSPLT